MNNSETNFLRHPVLFLINRIVGAILFFYLPSIGISQNKQHDFKNLNEQLSITKYDTGRIRILLEISTYFIKKPSEIKSDLDSGLHFLQMAEQLSAKQNEQLWLAKCAFTRSELLREKGDEENGKISIAKAIAYYSKTTSNKEQYADALIESAIYCHNEEEKELIKKIGLYNQAIRLYEQVPPSRKLPDCLKTLGELYTWSEDYKESIVTLEKSLAAYKAIDYKAVQEVYFLLGTCYDQFGNYKKAIQLGLTSIKVAYETGDTLTLAMLYNRLGVFYSSAKLYSNAREYFNKSLVISERKKDSASIAWTTINVSNVYAHLNKRDSVTKVLNFLEKHFVLDRMQVQNSLFGALASNYIALGQLQLAKPYIEKLLKIAEKHPGNISYLSIIKYNLAIKNYKNVYKYCNTYETTYVKNGVKNRLHTIYLYRFKADSATGKFISAIKQYQKYKALEDSLFSEENTQAINQLDIEYETTKKNDDLKLKESNIIVLNKEKKLQAAEISKNLTVRNVIIAGSAMLLVLLVLIYKQYSTKKIQYKKELSNNEELLAKQDEINGKNILLEQLVESKELLVKEVHHRVKNNLQIIMSLLNAQSDFSDTEQAFVTIRESRQRMYAISLIHQKLYHTDKQSIVKMNTYIPELVDFIKDGFVEGNRIDFKLIIEPIELDVAQAVPLGLILNEAITNAIKHAFKDLETGIIKISLSETADGKLTLIVSDNGHGLSPAVDMKKKESMGMQLMETLALQLNGEISFYNNSNGFSVELSFTQKLITAPFKI